MESRKRKILVIDDTESNRYLFSVLLSKAGYSVDVAASGLEGILKVRSQPDVIILDVNLPDMSGFEVCRKIRSYGFSRDIPVIQVSASYTTQSDFLNGHKFGADMYLVSPVDPHLFIECVNALSGSHPSL